MNRTSSENGFATGAPLDSFLHHRYNGGMPKSFFHSLWLLPALLFVTALPASAQGPAKEPKFVFDTGIPPWKGERIELPPGFARDLGWNGVEQIRFAPGMFDPDAPDFFSYVLVFLLSAEANTSEEKLEDELLTYYRGLSEAVMGGEGKTVDAEKFTISLEKAKNLKGAPSSADDVTSYAGILKWTEPFATQQAQTLHLEIFVWNHGEQPVVLSCVSPVAFDQDMPWKKLREIGTKFRFDP